MCNREPIAFMTIHFRPFSGRAIVLAVQRLVSSGATRPGWLSAHDTWRPTFGAIPFFHEEPGVLLTQKITDVETQQVAASAGVLLRPRHGTVFVDRLEYSALRVEHLPPEPDSRFKPQRDQVIQYVPDFTETLGTLLASM